MQPTSNDQEPGAQASDRARLLYLRRLGGWRLAGVVVIVQWIALGLAGLAAPAFGRTEPFRGEWMELVSPAADLTARLVSNWQRWDALWYQHIALSGYKPDDGSTAFYPLFPLLSRVVSVAFGGNIVIGQLVVSAAGYLVALALLWWLVRLEMLRGPGPAGRRAGDRRRRAIVVPTLTVLAIAAFPVGFAFLAPYTDSLFLVFTVAMFLAVRTGHPWIAGACALLAGLTRVQGILLALPLGWEVLQGSGVVAGLRSRRPPRVEALVPLIATLLPVAAWIAFTAFQVLVLDAHTTGLAAQARWGYAVVPPWDAAAASLAYIGRHIGSPAGIVEALNLASLVGFIVLGVLAVRRLRVSYAMYALPWLAVLSVRQMSFSPLMSVARYMIVAFPCFVVVALALEKRPRLAVAVLAAGGLLQLALFQYWVRWGFVA